MALPATAVWEIRSTATANNVNGGGFNSARGGTDYSLQDAAQVAQADGTSTASTTFTSALATFTSVMVGNYLHITSGTGATAGWYEIVTYVNANTITLDRTSGTYTAATFKVGGAMSLVSTLDDDMFEAGVAGNIYYIKGGSAITYTLGEALAIVTVGAVDKPIKIVGYATTRGDTPTGATRPTFAVAALAVALSTYWFIENIIFTGTSTNLVQTGVGGAITNCKITNSDISGGRVAIYVNFNSQFIYRNELISHRGVGLKDNDTRLTVLNNYIHDCDYGLYITSPETCLNVTGNIFAHNRSGAIDRTGTPTGHVSYQNNTFYGGENKIGTGIKIPANSAMVKLINNIFYGFVSAVEHATAGQTAVYDDYNTYYNNTTDVTNVTKGPNTIAVNPAFTNVTQVAGTTGFFDENDSYLTDSSKNFTTLGVVAGDIVMLRSGTGVTPLCVVINTVVNATTLNFGGVTVGVDVTADKVSSIMLGKNFLPPGAL